MEFILHFLIGIVVAIIASLPLGPVNLAVVQAAIHKGQRAALSIASGAVLTEVLYTLLAVMGTRLLFQNPHIQDTVLFYFKAASIPLLFFLGSYDMLKTIPRTRYHLDGTVHVKQRGVHNGFFLGFLLNLLNPVLLAYWVAISSYLQARGYLADETGPLYLYVTGVGAGTFLVMFFLSWVAVRRKRTMSFRTKVYISRIIGLVFFLMAVYQLLELMLYYLDKILTAFVGPTTPYTPCL
jgi:threonine/homoserine/homoserine lactone efflux protein